MEMRAGRLVICVLGILAALVPLTARAAASDATEDLTPLPREERLRRVEALLYIFESYPDDPSTKRYVAPLLALRADLTRRNARRAAAALQHLTGRDYGTDFEAWAAWFQTVQHRKGYEPYEFDRESEDDEEDSPHSIGTRLIGLLMIVGGIFSICGACFDWDWFMTARKARFFVAILTRTGARIFYLLLGFGLIVVGLLITLGVLAGG